MKVVAGVEGECDGVAEERENTKRVGVNRQGRGNEGAGRDR